MPLSIPVAPVPDPVLQPAPSREAGLCCLSGAGEPHMNDTISPWAKPISIVKKRRRRAAHTPIVGLLLAATFSAAIWSLFVSPLLAGAFLVVTAIIAVAVIISFLL